jgi:hypothetical protein
MADELSEQEQLVLRRTALRIHEQGWGIAVGSILGLSLFVATNVLVLKGGEEVGPHLGLLSVYFPGYRVSFAGSFIGFVYAFVLGYGIGATICALYNRLAVRLR